MKDNFRGFSRRDFLNLAGAGLAGLVLSEFDITGARAEGEVDFNLETSPNAKFIGFTVDAMVALNGRLSDSISSKYPSVFSSTSGARGLSIFKNSIATHDFGSRAFGWSLILSAAAGTMYGAPVALPGWDLASSADKLFGASDGTLFGKNPAKRFKNDWPGLEDFMIGDAVLIKETTFGASKIKEFTVLAKGNKTSDGAPAVLASYVDADTGAIVTNWMTQTDLQKQMGGLLTDNQVAAIRNQEIYDLAPQIAVWQRQYANDSAEISKGVIKNIGPERNARFLAGLFAQASSLSQTEAEANAWIMKKLGRTILAKNIDSKWAASQPELDKKAFGLALANLYYGTFPASKDLPDDYTDQFLTAGGLNNFINGVYDIGVVSHKPLSLGELNPADAVIVEPTKKLEKPLVGVVTSNGADGTNVMFFNKNGIGVPVMAKVTDVPGVAKLGGREGAKVTIVRSRDTEGRIWDDKKMAEHILDVSQILSEIAFVKPGFHHDFKSIPQAKALQEALASATNLKDRGEILMQMAGMMGVQTKGASAYAPVWNPDAGYDVCNLYSTDFVRFALGYGTEPGDISHWVADKDSGALTFNQGVELNAWGMNWWMRHFGEQHGWRNVTQVSLEERYGLLKDHIFYGAKSYANGTPGDTWLIFGVEDANGLPTPVLTKGSYNHLIVYPYRNYHFKDPMDYFNIFPDAIRFLPDTRAVLWAHKLPGA